MNQPAPDWPAAPTPDAAAAAPPMPPAPPAPAAPAPKQAMPPFAPPASPEAALDVTAPLMPVMPQQPAAPDFSAPAGFAAPETFAAPQRGLAPHVEHPTSLAMPAADPTAAPAAAMPSFADVMTGSPQPIGGVAAADPADLADHAATTIEFTIEPDADVDPTGQWWAPGIALVLAVAALAWQLVSFYARVQLPEVRASQTPLTNFDNVVGNLPLAGSAIGQIVGVVLAAGALGIVLYGSRRGLREPQLQVTIGAIAAVSLLAMFGLPMLRG